MSTPIRASQPISFSLLNDDYHPILEILDDVNGQNLNLEITNSSRRDLQLVDLTAPEAMLEKHHFELRFRRGVLDLDSEPNITLAGGDGWQMSKPTEANGTVSLYLLSKQPITLPAGASISLTLQHVNADERGGARGTKVELKYQNLEYTASDSQQQPEPLVAGQRVQHLSIGNQRGEKNIPLHVGFVGSNTILNDGATPNERTLRITNLLANESIPLSTTKPAVSQFILSFDVYDPGEQNEWALADSAALQNIQVQPVKIKDGQEVPDTDWSVTPNFQGETPEWVIKPQLNKTELPAGESIQLKLANIVSRTHTGPANVYLSYWNIYGYWDGRFITSLEKSHLIQRDQLHADKSYAQESYVGIGTDQPRTSLVLKKSAAQALGPILTLQNDGGRAGAGGAFDFNGYDVGANDATARVCSLDDGNYSSHLAFSTKEPGAAEKHLQERLRISSNGDVGVGTTDPKGKLQVAGDALIDGNVGIGKVDSKSKLHVSGDSRLA